jgi:AcrR family transcriptional regulator
MTTTEVLAGAAAGAAVEQGGRRRHQRNPRGQGATLSDEIVAGAIRLIEHTGSADAVTLRAVAREVGIAAPSIYLHFPDRAAILRAVVMRVFDELAAAIRASIAQAGEDPVRKLIAGCQAYVAFGLSHPARYRVVFSRPASDADCVEPAPVGEGGVPELEVGAEAFALLVCAIADCVSAGRSASTDPLGSATAVWVAMHGTVSLRISLPAFPWPDMAAFVPAFVRDLAKIRP